MKRLLPVFLCVALFAATIAAATASAQQVDYELAFGPPTSHLLDVTIRVADLHDSADFAMPAWAPGWYVINDYAKFVQEFSAKSQDGRDLAWRKTDKQTWHVELGAATTATIHYRVYGNTAGVDSMQFNDAHAHIPGPAVWMYLVNGKQRPAKLTIHSPNGWRVATGMTRSGENSFTAPDYDTFIDCPIEISNFAEKTFDLDGAKFHIIVHDVEAKKDFSQFAALLQKSIEQEIAIDAPVAGANGRKTPFAEYYFLFHVMPNTGGGLEHLNSTQIFFSSDWDAEGFSGAALTGLQSKVSTAVHEFLHAWNVKRVRPKPLGPFDYSREVNTPSLWISEGITDYYTPLSMARAGIITPDQYLQQMGQAITQLESAPGRKERSLEDTSFDTWFWYVGEGRFQTNEPNIDFSYYTGGHVMGQLLDLEIRNATQNKKSLDDWMRLMYSRYALPKPGFTPEDAVKAASEIAGTDMSDFFRRYISGKDVPRYDKILSYAGIEVTNAADVERGYFGMSVGRARDARSGMTISSIAGGSPAQSAGLDRGDVITAINGRSVDATTDAQALAAVKPGDNVTFTVSRLGTQHDVAVRAAIDPRVIYSLKLMNNPTAAQRAIFHSMLSPE